MINQGGKNYTQEWFVFDLFIVYEANSSQKSSTKQAPSWYEQAGGIMLENTSLGILFTTDTPPTSPFLQVASHYYAKNWEKVRNKIHKEGFNILSTPVCAAHRFGRSGECMNINVTQQ